MKRLASVCALASLAVLLGGCAAPKFADNPNATRFEASDQYKLQAAEHWHIIAEHMAAQLSRDLKDRGITRPLYIVPASKDYAFVEGFRELMTTAMVAQGWDMRLQPQNALPVDIRYSVYKFRPERASQVYHYGDVSMLVAGIWAISGIVESNISYGAKALATTASLEGFAWLKNEGRGDGVITNTPVPRSEIILTAMVSDNGKILARRSNLYYATDEDAALYWNSKGASHTVTVKGE
ncbi:MAG: hypothetical protein KGZ83_09590 [Sulfuricella sp.]|nr:hypothetical protein [Sulfuricella sp.]